MMTENRRGRRQEQDVNDNDNNDNNNDQHVRLATSGEADPTTLTTAITTTTTIPAQRQQPTQLSISSSFVRPVFESSICDLFGRRGNWPSRRQRRRQEGYYTTTTTTSSTSTSRNRVSNSNSSRGTDACAVAICGGLCLLQQRNHFLLTQQRPKPILSLRHRSVEILMVVLVLILLVVSAIVDDPYQYNMMWSLTGLMLLASVYKLFDFLHSSRVYRQQLAIYQWEMLQQQQQQHDDLENGGGGGGGINIGADRDDDGFGIDPELQSYLSYHNDEVYGNGSHVLCGCAREIEDDEDYYEEDHHGSYCDVLTTNNENNDETDYVNHNRVNAADGDFCTDLWTFIANSCCGAVCQCYCQVCGACATSQEHRHLRTVLPQPMKLSKARILSRQGPRRGHGQPQASQSAQIRQIPLASSSMERSSRGTSDTNDIYIAAADLWQRDYMTFEPWMDYFPSILKLRLGNVTSLMKHLQAMSVLSFRLVVSSVIFLIVATTMAIFLPVTFPRWQILVLYGTLLQPLIIMFVVHWVWHRLDLSMDAVVKYFASGFFLCTGMSILYEMIMSVLSSILIFLVTIISATGLVLFGGDEDAITFKTRKGYNDDDDDDAAVDMDRFTPTVRLPIQFTFVLAIFAAFVNAFLVAALVEELSKYLSFTMVEHPDVEREDIILLLPLDESERKAKADQKCDVKGDEVDEVDADETSKLVRSGNEVSARMYDKRELIASPIASLVSAGAAITIGMVATALGFACAENLLYVFLYTPPGLDAELSTLMIRCLFPIHPLAAALQSIGVVRRDLERDPSVGVGRIILPAWIMHGSFDFALMAFSLVSQVLTSKSSHGSKAGKSILVDSMVSIASITEADGDDDGDQSSTYVISFVLIIPVIGMVYYFQEAWDQRDRLEALDQKIGVRPTSSQSEDGR